MNICELIESNNSQENSKDYALEQEGCDKDGQSNDNQNLVSNENVNNKSQDQQLDNEQTQQQQQQELKILDKFYKLCELQEFEDAVKILVQALDACETNAEYSKVFSYLREACFIQDVIIRSMWIEQIPNIAYYFHNISILDENLKIEISIILSQLYQYGYLYQTRKLASFVLLQLVERGLLEIDKIEQYIIPCLLNLINENSDEIHVECISVFGKLAPILGRDTTVKHLLAPFCRLCSSTAFHTRKVCASNMGEFAQTISDEEVEQYLLVHFIQFINDQVWAIRKVCAEIFPIIAQKCSLNTRKQLLTDYFLKLLEDNSRWVKISAYKTLGSFIASFIAKPNETINNTNDQTQVVRVSIDLNEVKPEVKIEDASEQKFNTFNYWRSPLPHLVELETIPNPKMTISGGPSTSASNEQNIIPPKLLSFYLQMVDMNTQTSLDSEMNYNCAFNLPAIAYTLGATYWSHLRELYKKLAEDVNWKVRQTLAFSIHELAQILGTRLTQSDLVPIFDSFIKDVDEVRIGIVSNMSKFLRVLESNYRQAYMPKLSDFLKMDNQRNWRFRNELASQIALFCDLFSTEYIFKYIQPIVISLALDKVSEVRVTATRALTQILKQYNQANDFSKRNSLFTETQQQFAKNSKWSMRQLYVVLCENIIQEQADSLNSFSQDFLPNLLELRSDNVANVRICLSRVLSNFISTHEDSFNANTELKRTIQHLTNDTDCDVKSYLFKYSCAFEARECIQQQQEEQNQLA